MEKKLILTKQVLKEDIISFGTTTELWLLIEFVKIATVITMLETAYRNDNGELVRKERMNRSKLTEVKKCPECGKWYEKEEMIKLNIHLDRLRDSSWEHSYTIKEVCFNCANKENHPLLP